MTGQRCDRSCSLAALLFAALLALGHTQVQRLQFVDTDTDAGQIGGNIYWDKPAAGDAGYDYAAYLATDASGTGKAQLPIGAAAGLSGGADISTFPMPADTAIGSYTHIVVYMKASGTGVLSNSAAICIIDNPTGFIRTVYATTTGYTKANNARNAIVTGCHASLESITVEMVATAKWTGTAVSETTFDETNEESATASFMVKFPTGSTFGDVETALASYVDDAPVPAVFTGTSSDSAYSLGNIRAYSRLDQFVYDSPDPDIARYIARSCIHFSVAGAVIVRRDGTVRIQTKADKQTAVKQMANVYLNTDAVTYEDMGGASGTLTAIAAGSTAAQALCYQVTGADSEPSCLSPYTV